MKSLLAGFLLLSFGGMQEASAAYSITYENGDLEADGFYEYVKVQGTLDGFGYTVHESDLGNVTVDDPHATSTVYAYAANTCTEEEVAGTGPECNKSGDGYNDPVKGFVYYDDLDSGFANTDTEFIYQISFESATLESITVDMDYAFNNSISLSLDYGTEGSVSTNAALAIENTATGEEIFYDESVLKSSSILFNDVGDGFVGESIKSSGNTESIVFETNTIYNIALASSVSIGWAPYSYDSDVFVFGYAYADPIFNIGSADVDNVSINYSLPFDTYTYKLNENHVTSVPESSGLLLLSIGLLGLGGLRRRRR